MNTIDLSKISTLLFDIDNTLILFDEQKFVPIYSKLIFNYFKEHIHDFNKFVQIFLASTHKMLEKKPPNMTNMEKFAKYFSSQIPSLTAEEIRNKFIVFYESDFKTLRKVVRPNPLARKLLKLATPHFNLVAATNPLFPAIANEIRLEWGEIGSKDINWLEISSAEYYFNAKPHIEYYEELLSNIGKKPSECLMIGNDKVNDMIAGKIGIKTYLVEDSTFTYEKVIKTKLDDENTDFPIDYKGSLTDLYNQVKLFLQNN